MKDSCPKDLKDMSLEELWQLFPIELVPYRDEWPIWAKQEIDTLSDKLDCFSPVIHHIGSTAVSGLTSKPIIDLLVEVSPECNRSAIKAILERCGYICMSQTDARMSFNKGYTPCGYAEKVFHVHVRPVGDNDEIYFRDYLRTHSETAAQYEALKLSLLPKFKNNRDGYTAAKTDFINHITTIAKSSKQ